MIELRLVRQSEPSGCAVACLAMVLGITYAEAAKKFKHRRDFKKSGVTMQALDRQVVKAGYAIARWFGYDRPVAPFAEIHIALVHLHAAERGENHYVVWTRDGVVLDPLSDDPKTLGYEHYSHVLNVAGLYRVML